MGLFSWDMKSCISCNDRKNISHNIMQDHPLPHHMCNQKDETLLDSKVVYKCSATFQNVTKSKRWKNSL